MYIFRLLLSAKLFQPIETKDKPTSQTIFEVKKFYAEDM